MPKMTPEMSDEEAAVRVEAASRLKRSFHEFDADRRYAVGVLGPVDVDALLNCWGRTKPKAG